MGILILILAWSNAQRLYLRLGFKEVERLVEGGMPYGIAEYSSYFIVYDVIKGAVV